MLEIWKAVEFERILLVQFELELLRLLQHVILKIWKFKLFEMCLKYEFCEEEKWFIFEIQLSLIF